MSNDRPQHRQLRVWHIPQVPMARFFVPVNSVKEGKKIMKVLADYDLFQLKHNVKGDYCNVQGLEMWDETCPDDEGNCWTDVDER